MKKTLVIGLAALATCGFAQAGDLSVSADVTFASKYIFRGLQFADNSLQPSVEITQDTFYAGIWANQPLENRSSLNLEDEIDFYVGFTPKLSDTVSLDLGATHYYYTGASGRQETDNTTEAFIGANFAAGSLTPGVYAYYDFDLEAFTVQGNLGFSIPMDAMGSSLDLAASVGSVSPDEGDSYVYYNVGAAIPYKLNEHATLKVGINWASHDLDGFEDDHLWYTAGITVGF
jgi:uncharacterized protein (TIGR02001 family)